MVRCGRPHREDASAERVRFGDLRVLWVREKGKVSYLLHDLAGQKARSALAQRLECFNYHQRRIPGGYAKMSSRTSKPSCQGRRRVLLLLRVPAGAFVVFLKISISSPHQQDFELA